ncbi:MAG: hypothetical protein DYG89_13980 [Caldilinea sp. CFX5]|nr:hypothetical protein [Caldilinea sp. CFX5]
MLNQHQLEILTYERQRAFHVEAEERRLAKVAASGRSPFVSTLRCRLGACLVQWGCTLQGVTAPLPLPLEPLPHPARQ